MYMFAYTSIYADIHCRYAQDTVVVVPPYPYGIKEDRLDVDLEDCWYARPQLFFKCYLRTKNAREPKNSTYKAGPGIYMYIHVYTCISHNMCVYSGLSMFNYCLPDDLLRELVFFNTFEELKLPIKGPTEDAEVVKLYQPSSTPCLYVAPAENMVGRVPLYAIVSGWKCDSDDPSPVQQAQGFGFPHGLR